ncbi:hypothetical protein EDEG_01008 [Edhazardia aedis USNM 41457]|uniref:Uncharacterized protein n=1 Tax=Edhazardia aedis (strain USNM 41457) TaxID=1003232 RepID=J9DAK5_EDHAE|nr:hypothetical protein EDEG_01008 [Edhazardia aedis USNM 41457]|eukprot:EJW04786.1 hypothetical protein EDEG_01008 [Edhazardia aedis USNM 41457]
MIAIEKKMFKALAIQERGSLKNKKLKNIQKHNLCFHLKFFFGKIFSDKTKSRHKTFNKSHQSTKQKVNHQNFNKNIRKTIVKFPILLSLLTKLTFNPIMLFMERISSSLAISMIGEIHDSFKGKERIIFYGILGCIGLFLAILGVNYLRISFFLLTFIGISTFFFDGIKYLSENATSCNLFFLTIPETYIKSFVEKITNNKKETFFLILFLSIVIACFIKALTKSLIYFGIFVAYIYIYNEGIHDKILTLIGYDGNKYYLGLLVFAIMAIVIFYVFLKTPMFIFAGVFSFIGPLFTIICIEQLTNSDFGFSKAVNDRQLPTDNEITMKYMISYALICGICFTIQSMMILKGKANL